MRTCLAALAMVLLATPLRSQCTDAEKLKLQELDKSWSEATRRGDRAQLNAIIANDFAATTITGTVDKAATIDAAVRAAEQSRASGRTPPVTATDHYVITCTPATAVVTHRNSTPTILAGKGGNVVHSQRSRDGETQGTLAGRRERRSRTVRRSARALHGKRLERGAQAKGHRVVRTAPRGRRHDVHEHRQRYNRKARHSRPSPPTRACSNPSRRWSPTSASRAMSRS